MLVEGKRGRSLWRFEERSKEVSEGKEKGGGFVVPRYFQNRTPATHLQHTCNCPFLVKLRGLKEQLLVWFVVTFIATRLFLL